LNKDIPEDITQEISFEMRKLNFRRRTGRRFNKKDGMAIK
jgi:hypothetical protein